MLKLYYQLHKVRQNLIERLPSLYHALSLLGILFWVFAFKSVIIDANNIPTGSMIPTLKIGDFLFVNKMRYTLHLPFTDIHLFRYDLPKRGDVVTFTPPANDLSLQGKTLVKRVIAVGGDHVAVEDDEIIVNGVRYPVERVTDYAILSDIDYPKINTGQSKEDLELFIESILDPATGETVKEHYMMKHIFNDAYSNNMRNPQRTWRVPEGKYMVMGDNRDNSDDSRRWGFVDADDIHGKVFMIYFSVNWNSRMHPFEEPVNPIFSLGRLLKGKLTGVDVRWNRVGTLIE